MNYYDIHRHSEFSLFDGMGKAKGIVKYAKELGYDAIGNTDHGNITGLIKHYKACVEYDIIPILGCEFYFQPKINNDKPYYHICIFVKNKKGWENLNKLITLSNSEENFYYRNKISFDNLKECSEGIICSTACIGGYIPTLIKKEKIELAEKIILKFKKLFGERFFIEIQPIELKEEEGKGKENLQIKVNEVLLKLAKKHNIGVICTSDSHYIKKEDYDTYLKMLEIKKSTYGSTYSERYMPTKEEMKKRINKYHFDFVDIISNGMERFLEEVGDAREWFSFVPDIPKYSESPEESYKLMKKQAIRFLKNNDKFDEEYKKRLKKEFEVIKYHGFQDYFMIVQDYVNWAKNNDIAVGPGRGSAGNSLTNYALGITLVDPVKFGNDFDRFLRKDRKKFPDIDVDFGQDRRDEVIDYIIKTYKGRASQTLTYGMYNVKNLVNDLVKVCGCTNSKDIEDIKKFLSQHCNDNENIIDVEAITSSSKYNKYNSLYDNIIKHFMKLYGKVRYFGTHASSVILSSHAIESEAGLCRIGGKLRTSFDLHDIEFLGLLKLDVLGLSSATKAKNLEEITGDKFNYSMLNDKKTLKVFNEDPTAIFQFESKSSYELVKMIGIDNFEDIVASVALNRPGPLTLGMHENYAQNKLNPPKDTLWYKYTKSSYGTLIYQEQTMQIAKEIGGYDPSEADDIAKSDINHISVEKEKLYRKKFIKNAISNGVKREDAISLFNSMLGYSFNRGHAIAYAMLAAELGYFKANYSDEFWFITLKHEFKEENIFRDEALYIRSGGLIMLPHVNGPAEYALSNFDGEKVIIKGMVNIKNVGLKAAQFIEEERIKNGNFTDLDEFLDRCKNRIVNKRVLDALEDNGALCFNKNKYLKSVERYNTSILSKGY